MRYTNVNELYRQVQKNSLKRAILNLSEKLGANATMGDYISDFQKSDAPQFKGRTKEQRKKMAIAAYLDKTGQTREELELDEEWNEEETNKRMDIIGQNGNDGLHYDKVELDEAEVSVYGFISTGERKKFLDNLKSMRLQFKSKVMNLPDPVPATGLLNFDADQSTINAIIKFAKRMKLKIMKEEVELDEIKEPFVVVDTADGNKVVATASDEKGAKSSIASAELPPMKIKDKKTLKVMKSKKKQMIGQPFKEEVKLKETIVDFDYSRNPKGIYNAFLQMSKKLGLTLFNAPTGMTDLKNKGTGRIGGTKQNMLKFMKYLNSKGIEPSVEIVNEEVELDENFRKLAMKGMGTETKRDARVGLKTDYYLPSNGDKSFGKIMRVSKDGYEIEDEKTKKTYKFKFYDPQVAKKLMSGKTEEDELDEAKSATGYELYHDSFSDAMQHAYSHAKKKFGMTVDPKEIDNKVATGPKKPGQGKTNSYSLKTNKGTLQIQVYNKGGSKPYELNMYQESIGEAIDPADIDDTASQKDIEAASRNIIMQLRKSVSMNGQKDVEFADGKKVKVKANIAQAVLSKYNKQRTSIDKGKFQMQIAKSYADLLKATKGK